jgi:hypothetical protein
MLTQTMPIATPVTPPRGGTEYTLKTQLILRNSTTFSPGTKQTKARATNLAKRSRPSRKV